MSMYVPLKIQILVVQPENAELSVVDVRSSACEKAPQNGEDVLEMWLVGSQQTHDSKPSKVPREVMVAMVVELKVAVGVEPLE
jgi:hypothetical protein